MAKCLFRTVHTHRVATVASVHISSNLCLARGSSCYSTYLIGVQSAQVSRKGGHISEATVLHLLHESVRKLPAQNACTHTVWRASAQRENEPRCPHVGQETMVKWDVAARKSLPRVDQDPFCDTFASGQMSYLIIEQIIVHTDPACTLFARNQPGSKGKSILVRGEERFSSPVTSLGPSRKQKRVAA